MGTRKEWATLALRLGKNYGDLQDSLSEEGRAIACTIWRDFPDQVSANASLSRSFVRGYMSSICSDKPLPVLEPPPFTGGQCDGVLYNVEISRSLYNISNCQEVISGTVTVQVTGPVQGIVKQIIQVAQTTTACNGLAGDPVDLTDWLLLSADPPLVVATGAYTDPNENANPPLSNFTILSVTRADGMPDNCGDLPLEYPPTSPNIPNDYTFNTSITLADGVDLNLTYFYDTSRQTFPMQFDVNGIQMIFDLGGVEFSYTKINNDGGAGTLADGQPAPQPVPADDENRKFDVVQPPPPNSDDYEEIQKTETDPKEEEIGEEIEFVRVTVTSFPVNVKNQNGDGAPNVYYCGWFEFQANGYNFPRQPIHFLNNVYRKPQGATGYAYTLYQGITGQATIYKLKTEV